MKKLSVLLATVLICFCFLADVNHDKQTILFCNDSDKGNENVITSTEDVKVLIDWRKDKKDCVGECSYWRTLKLLPEGIICTEIQYNFGKKNI